MMLERFRYNFEKPKETELPIEWEKYAKIIKNELSLLLSDDNKSEIDYQSFFEQHPCMLPRPFDCNVGVTDFAFPGLISHPVLPSFDKKIPDFMWMTMNSLVYCATFIEIENPTKVWFTSNGQPRAELTQAINQIKSWKVWFKEPTNVTKFLDFYNISVRSRKRYTFKQGYLLIYGRRDDKTINDNTNKIRDELQDSKFSIMTYDRLSPNSMLSNALCVKQKNGHYPCYFCTTNV